MFRIVRKSRERDLTDALLAERERLVMLLAEQVEYLRAQLNMPTRTVTNTLEAYAPRALDTQLEPSRFDIGADLPDGVTREVTGILTDEEEELLAMKQAGLITEAQYEEALERLKLGPDIIE
jgi:hypothetical protein